MKAGVDLYLPMRNVFQDEPGTRGDLTFTGIFTSQRTAPGKSVSGTGFAYADGLLGATQSTQLTNVFFVDQRLWMASGFFEDDWKATPKLTVNAGLRYDFATPAYEGQNRMANFDPNSGSLVFAKAGSLQDRTIVKPNTHDLAPRIGFAYSVTPLTVVRAGYGIYYDLFERIGSEDQLSLNPPGLINKALSSSTTPVLTPAVGFPSNFLDPATINFNNLSAFHIRSIPVNNPDSMIQHGICVLPIRIQGALITLRKSSKAIRAVHRMAVTMRHGTVRATSTFRIVSRSATYMSCRSATESPCCMRARSRGYLAGGRLPACTPTTAVILSRSMRTTDRGTMRLILLALLRQFPTRWAHRTW
jgi:hypothetical protein